MINYDYSTATKIEQLPINMSVSDVADFLGLSITSAYKLVQADDFPKLKMTTIRRIIIPKHQFILWYNKDVIEYPSV